MKIPFQNRPCARLPRIFAWLGVRQSRVIARDLSRMAKRRPPDQNSEIVIVPYDSKKPIDEQKPDQFYLPYERFLQLWQAAKEHRAGPASEIAKFPFALTSARYDGVQSERSLAFTGKLDITTTNDAWVKVPLPFSGVKIGGLKIDSQRTVFDRRHTDRY